MLLSMLENKGNDLCVVQACLDIDFAKEVLLEDKIGSGAFGTVYRGVCYVRVFKP